MKNLIEIVNSEPMTTSLVIAEQFGRAHKNVIADIKRLIDNDTISQLDFKPRDYGSRGKKYPMYELTERGFLIAMPFIGGDKAEEGQARLVDAFLSSRNRSEPDPRLSMIELQVAEVAARMLRMSETSKIRMLGKICSTKGASTEFLPSYVDETLTRSLGELLKENGSGLSAIAANKILVKMGYLEELQRKSSRGTKPFKSVTQDGLEFGKNETSPQSPNQTQPRYFVSAFPELLGIINRRVNGNVTNIDTVR